MPSMATAGSGHLYQGRFKAFPVEGDEHFLTGLASSESNSLRTGLCERAGVGPIAALPIVERMRQWIRFDNICALADAAAARLEQPSESTANGKRPGGGALRCVQRASHMVARLDREDDAAPRTAIDLSDAQADQEKSKNESECGAKP